MLILCFYCYRGVPFHFKEVAQKQNIMNSVEGGEQVKIGFAKVIEVMEEGKIIIDVMNKQIEVKEKQPNIRPGQRISLTGHFVSDNQFVAETIVVHKYRWLKKLVSALTTLLVVFIMLIQYKVLVKDRIIVERSKCPT